MYSKKEYDSRREKNNDLFYAWSLNFYYLAIESNLFYLENSSRRH